MPHLLTVLVTVAIGVVSGFTTNQRHRLYHCKVPKNKHDNLQIVVHNGSNNDNGETDSRGTKIDMNPFTKSVWYGVEKFGQVFGSKTSSSLVTRQDEFSGPPKSLEETVQRIKLDNDRSYFLSGDMDTEIYDPQCSFSDPFVSFRGRQRFVENLQNLGSFITKYDAKVIKYSDIGGGSSFESDAVPTIETKIMVKLELNLPWKPVLAWPWGVTYEIDRETFLVTKHEESWDIEPLEGVKQIFRRATVKL